MRLIVATSSFPTHPDEAINAGVFVWAVAKALTAQGHDVWVFTPDKGEPIRGFPVPVETFPWGGSEKVLTRLNPRRLPDLYRLGRLMVQGRRALARLARRVRADGILATWVIPSGFWAAGSHVPFAVWALGSDIWGIARYPLGKQVTQSILRSADHVFANSHYLIGEIEALAGQPAEFLAASRGLPVDSIPAASLPAGGPQFLFIGRWDPAKGPDVLLEAMPLLKARLPEAHLHLFGGGPMEQSLRQRATQPDLRDVVTVYGYADPVTATAYLKGCDALVMPSRIESVPVLFSDALTCGCPVVSTTVGDLGRLVRENKVGLLCPPEDPQALADAMATIVTGEQPARARYGDAIQRATRLFDPARSAERCAAVLAALQ
ncbi:MAG: glycosyltransferase [Chloroflexota bacterium]|nr:glycosyltransferase [Chloroflexota bacterium]